MLVSFTQMRLFSLISLFTMPLMAAFTLLPPAVAEEVVTSENSEESTQDTDRSQAFSPNPEDATNPESLRPLAQETSLLSLEAGNRLISEGKSAIADENYAQAADKLHQARQIFNQLSNFHQQLSASFSGVDNQVAEFHRYQAVETAQKRDEATYELAVVHRTENQPELSVPLLIQVIQSQGITRDLGKQADLQLSELGFGPAIAQTEDEPETIPPLAREGSLLGVEAGQRLLERAKEAISHEDYETAAQQLQQARAMLNQVSNFSEQLAASFSGIDPDRSEFHRTQAVDTAQMRDEATYQLALVHRADNKAELAIPLLIQIIRSQQPTRELGKQAYEQLYELGFVSSPYSSNASDSNPPNFSSNQ
jgi:flagellin-specific chaperone FliS/sorbitol-specific phosphotransferase system component IIA